MPNNNRVSVTCGDDAAIMLEYLEYNPTDGLFRWRDGHSRAGMVAGTPNTSGHVQVSAGGYRCLAHRLAWYVLYGSWPADHQIDHRDCDPSNNRPANLRACDRFENMQNRRGTRGLWAVRNRFHAAINYRHKRYNLGTFSTEAEARAAYTAAKRILHTFQKTVPV